LADSVSRLSGGVYDITVMPLVKAWGFARKGASESGAVVSEPNIDSLLEFVGHEKISIKDGRLVKEDARIELDFNSIAKGYTVDKLAHIVESLGAENYLVDIGGELYCRGVNSSGIGWRIGVERPFDGNMTSGEYVKRRISMDPRSGLRAMATSGNYRRFYIDNSGRKIAHTIDPRTGRSSISTLLSVTVMAKTCALADSYATMFMALGSAAAEEVAHKIDDIEVYFIYGDSGKQDSTSYREYISPGLQGMLME
ncbi:MAG: FAD:protein FMN transferase, partial [Rikenellaceae bacterium]